MNDFKLTIAILTILLPYVLYSNSQPDFSTKYGNTTQNVENITESVNNAFSIAEKEVFGKDVEPETIIIPDPDPKKCVCKGSGKIVHGDGHTTDCPFHSSKMFIKKLNTGE